MWSEEDWIEFRIAWDSACPSLQRNHAVIQAIATRAVELVAARGGAMTAEQAAEAISSLLETIDLLDGNMSAFKSEDTDRLHALQGHLVHQGARVAVLEADTLRLAQEAEESVKERDGLSANFTAACRKADEQRERAEKAEAERDTAVQLAAHRLKGRMEAAEEAERLRVERDAAEEKLQRLVACGKSDLTVMGEYKQRWEDAEARLQRVRDGISDIVKRCVEMAKVLGEPPDGRTIVSTRPTALPDHMSKIEHYPQTHPHAFVPSPDGLDMCAAPASNTICGYPRHDHRYPCSPTCTHDDAAKPGHPERVKERSEAFNTAGICASEQCDRHTVYEQGVEAMRAACWEAIRHECERDGIGERSYIYKRFKDAIEGATP